MECRYEIYLLLWNLQLHKSKKASLILSARFYINNLFDIFTVVILHLNFDMLTLVVYWLHKRTKMCSIFIMCHPETNYLKLHGEILPHCLTISVCFCFVTLTAAHKPKKCANSSGFKRMQKYWLLPMLSNSFEKHTNRHLVKMLDDSEIWHNLQLVSGWLLVPTKYFFVFMIFWTEIMWHHISLESPCLQFIWYWFMGFLFFWA